MKSFVVVCILTYLIAPIVFYLSLPIVFGQTPTTPLPTEDLGNFNFIPQDAIVTVLPPKGYEIPNQQQQNGIDFGDGSIAGIIAGLTGTGVAVYKTITQGKKIENVETKTAVNSNEILKGKQVDAELGRVSYQMNPEKAKELNDAPLVKMETLQEDVQQFQEKITKGKVAEPPKDTD